MAIARRGTPTTASSNTSAITINVPTGVVSGDILFLQIGANLSTSGSATLSGWTAVPGYTVQSAANTALQVLLYRISAGSEPASYSPSLSGTGHWAATMIAYSGVDNANPFAGITQKVIGTATTAASFQAATPQTDSAYGVLFGIAHNATATSTITAASSGYSVAADVCSTTTAFTEAFIEDSHTAYTLPLASITPGSATCSQSSTFSVATMFLRPNLSAANTPQIDYIATVSNTTSVFSTPAITTGYTKEMVLVSIQTGSSSPSVTSVTDTAGNTYARASVATVAATRQTDVWYTIAANAMSGNVITFNGPSAVTNVVQVMTFHGSSPVTALGAVNQTTGSSSIDALAVTTTKTNSRVVSFSVLNSTTAPTAATSNTIAATSTASTWEGTASISTAVVASSGTSFTAGTSAPSAVSYAIVDVEVLANSSPTIALNTADLSSFSTATPTLAFTGTDADSDDIRYNVQIDTVNTFDSGNGIIDSYDVSNISTSVRMATDAFYQVGQSFTGNGNTISSVQVKLQLTGLPSGSMTANIYAHSGTFGTSSVPTGSALATSDAIVQTTLPTTAALVSFNFSTAFTPVNGTKYVLMMTPTGNNSVSSSRYVDISTDNTSPTHAGNLITGTNVSVWSADNTQDLCFYINKAGMVANKVSGTDAGFSGSPDNTDPFTSGQQVSYTAQSSLANGTYYWRARAIDPSGTNTYSAWPTTRSFTVSSGPTTISITKSLMYTVKTTPTAPSKSLKYTIKKTASALTKGLIYDIKKPVALTKTLIYDIKRTPAALTKALIYRVKKTYSITKSLIYDIKHATALTKSLKYTVIKSISATKSLKYTTKTTPSAITKALQYRIRLPTITLTKGLIYDVRHSISITKSLRYAVLKTTAVTKGLVYIVKRPVVLTKSLKYTVKKTLSTTKSLAYDIRTTPTAISKSLRYGIRKTYSQTKTLQYAVRPTIAVSKSLKYTIRKSIAQTKVLKYTIRISAISLTKALRYAIVKSQPITKSLRYTVKKTYTVTKSLAYVTTGGSILTKSLRYTITHSTAITTSLRYAINVRHKHNLDKSLTYRIAAPVAITKSLVYTINISLSTTKPLRYTIAKARATTKTLYYVVTARHAIQKALQYNLNVSARPTTPLQLGNDANILTLDASPSTPLLATDSRSIHLGNNETTTFLRDDVNTVILN